MINDYLMPKLAMAMNEGTVNEWLAEEGAFIEAGAPVVTVETEKVSYDLEAPHSGFLHIVVPQGETVPVEILIARFAETREELTTIAKNGHSDLNESADTADQTAVTKQNTVPDEALKNNDARIKATPVVRKLAREKGIDLHNITGSGPGGRIVKRDILEAKAVASKPAGEVPLDPATIQPATTQSSSQSLTEKARIPVKGKIRATIAKRLVESLHSTAQLSSSWESDLTELLKFRETFTSRQDQLGTRVSINAFLIKSIVYAVKQLPLANSALVGDEIVLYENVNMGIAVALPGETEYDTTLIVPVLKHVEHMGVVEIDLRMKDLIDRARKGSLTAEDMTESTITLSSTAGIAPPGLQSTPVLNMPNAVIVGPSTPQQKPIVKDGEVAIRTVLPVSVTFDHRVMDGEPAARFMLHLHECLENPQLMLL
jgi:pyruvate/2-oxoglutarate dehydrogenase complex dihydrolipoamide acyltransferase (E2) component